MAEGVVSVVAHASLSVGRDLAREAELAEREALFLTQGLADEIGQGGGEICVKRGISRLEIPLVTVPAVGVSLLVDVRDRPVDVGHARIARRIGRLQADVESVAHEGALHLAVDLGVLVPVLREPGVGRPHRKLVREAVVADLRALPLLHEVFEARGDGFAVRLRVEVVRDHRHAPGHEVERRARTAEGRVVVVGETVHRLARPVPVAGEHARVRRRDLAERLEDALVAELVRHDRRHRGLGVVETEPAPQPALAGLCEHDAAFRRQTRARPRNGHGEKAYFRVLHKSLRDQQQRKSRTPTMRMDSSCAVSVYSLKANPPGLTLTTACPSGARNPDRPS